MKILNSKLFFAIAIAILLLGGCAQKRERSLTFAIGGAPSEIAFWESLIQDFEQQTNIHIDILRQPTDTDQRRQGLVIPLKAAHGNPDIFLMDIAWLAQFAASYWLEPLDEYIERDSFEVDVFFDRIFSLADKYNGETVAFPVYVDGGLLYYRKDLLDRKSVV